MQTEFSLKDMVKARFSRLISSTMLSASIKQMVLVLDTHTVSLLSNLFGLSELVGLGIVMLQKLQLKRKRLQMHALYFVQPRESNMASIIEDFKDKDAPLYTRLHILFPYKCSKEMLNMLSLDQRVIKRIRSIKQFYHSNFFLQSNVLTMKLEYLEVAYSDLNSNRERKIRERLSTKFIEIFRSLHSFFQVNLYYKKSPSGVAQRVANSICAQFRTFIDNIIMQKSHLLNKQAAKVEVLVIDRSIDPVTPLLHDFFYQPMLFDVLDFKLDQVQTKQEKESDALPRGLNQIQDQAYDKYRYRHIADILEQLPRDIVDLSNKVKQVTTENMLEVDINIAKKYEMHMKLVRECETKFKEEKLAYIGELEQSLATGIDINAAETSSVKLIDEITLMESGLLSPQDTVRLALIAYCCISFSERDYKRLTKEIPKKFYKLFVKMLWLGVTLSMETKRSTKNIKQNIRKIAEQKLNSRNMNLSRYSSIIELILPIIAEGLLNNVSIDQDIFGKVTLNQSEKREEVPKKEREHRKREKIIVHQSKGKRTLIVLFIGGGSYAEIRAIKNLNLEEQLNLIVIADMFMTPQQYIDSIGNMKQPN